MKEKLGATHPDPWCGQGDVRAALGISSCIQLILIRIRTIFR